MDKTSDNGIIVIVNLLYIFMKHINWNNIIRATALGMLLLALVVSYQNIADAQSASCDLQNTYLTTAGNASGCAPGVLDISQFELAPKTVNSVTAISSSLGTSTIFSGANPINFRLAGTSFVDSVAAFRDTAFSSVFVGMIPPLVIPAGEPELQVNGTIRIESLADDRAADFVPACVTDFGRIIRCSP